MMDILTIGLESYINYHIKNELLKENKVNNCEYEDILGVNFIDNLNLYKEHDVLIVGIDKSFYINQLEFSIYFNVLNNIIYLLNNTDKINKVVFLSSYGVYKEKEDDCYKENDEVLPGDYISNIYLSYENMLRIACNNNDINLIIVRLFNLYGLYQNEDFVIMSIIKQFYDGEYISIGDSRKKRDYIYIKDFIEYIKIIVYKSFDEKFNVYNLGTGSCQSVKDIISILEKLTGQKKKTVFNSQKLRVNFDYDDVKADISKNIRDFNFVPKFDLLKGLNELLELYLISRGKLLWKLHWF